MEIFDCKYYLKCGMCELKKTECTYFKPLDTPQIYRPFSPYENIPVSVYGCPPISVTTQLSKKVPGTDGITYDM